MFVLKKFICRSYILNLLHKLKYVIYHYKKEESQNEKENWSDV